jgi:asparagine synthase (glutamine-hydrolysing)
MCGIAGFVLPAGPEGLPPRETRLAWLSAMTDAMRHRGPDGDGLALVGPAALGHRRLSIIDLAAGSQPMSDAGELATVTFNGEIYNYRELKARFAADGFTFRTKSDTEAILAAWLTMGQAGLDLLEGMFAFALWDSRTQTL